MIMSIKDVLNRIYDQLKGIYPDTELSSIAFIILEHVLNYTKTDILIRKNELLEADKIEHLDSIITRLRNYEPVQYVLGETEFYGLKFKLTNDVLIPRQETEELVDWIIKDNKSRSTEFDILDIGTGSGCIAISLAKHIKNCKVSAIDFCDSVIKIAKLNAEQNDVCVDFHKFNILKDQYVEKEFDVIVSNPPYIRYFEKNMMAKNVLDFEPESALFVPDDDPLKFYNAIIKLCSKNLKKFGILYLEINECLGKETKNLLAENDFVSIEIRNDINDKPRMIKAIYER